MPSETEVRFTPTEERILKLFSDGERHRKEEIRGKCMDPLSELAGVRVHIKSLRQKIPNGRLIVCEVDRRIAYYRMVYRYTI